jgi:CubicO group peptidase (beta-lactamase class C family)
MAKTIVALLIGIAVGEGRIKSIADTAETYVPQLKGSEFGRTPIKALLQMSSGIKFQHGFDASASIGDLARLNKGPPGFKGVLQFNERAAPPGTRFNYSAADTRVLGMVLAGATGKSVSDYASEKLWKPLGAEAPATWWIDKSGQELTSCCFAARLRDYARLGLMLAHDGAWNGRQIVPPEWLRAATTVAETDTYLKPRSMTPVWGYGYQVWLLADGRQFVMRGLRGQMVFVDPDTKTVMVRTAVEPFNTDSGETRSLWRGVLEWIR